MHAAVERGPFDEREGEWRELAHIAGVSRGEMSGMLQDYRYLQSTGRTQYIVQARGYGRSAIWRILHKPGNDAKAVRTARHSALAWSTGDAFRRLAKDAACEVSPAVARHQEVLDDVIEQNVPYFIDQLDAIVRHVERLTGANGTA